MARQLRIEYPGAFYHVTSRGNQKYPVFFNELNYNRFLEYLAESHETHAAVFHGYCLMENHFHFILETPRGNISQIMHFINTAYSIYLNKSQGRVGHLFQGRFKSLLIDAESYALTLSRYIHMNPVRAEIVKRPELYGWSSYRDYIGLRPKPAWLRMDFILGHFGHERVSARRRYASFVISEAAQDAESLRREIQRSVILGSPEYIDKVKGFLSLDHPRDPELPQLQKLNERPALPRIRLESDRVLGRYNRYARDAAIFVSRKRAQYSLRNVADYFEMSRTGVAKACKRMKEILLTNETLRRAISDIEESLNH